MMRGYFNFNDVDRFGRMGSSFGGEFMWVGMLLHVLFVIAVFVLIIWVVKTLVKSHNAKVITSNKSLDIIKERLAKGEITKEEYDILYKNLV
jgi:putative membrane protein